MKKLLIASAIVATFVTPQAFAQAKNFEGFSVLGGVNVAAATFEQNAKNGSSSTSATSTSSNFQLQAEYTMAAGQQFTVGVGVNAGLGDLLFGRWAATGVDLKLKDTLAVYVAPGYAVSDTTLVYGKIAAISGTAADTSSVSLSGVGYGAGARFLSGKNVYYQVEFMQNQYSDKEFTTVIDKFKSSVFSFGVGYKF